MSTSLDYESEPDDPDDLSLNYISNEYDHEARWKHMLGNYSQHVHSPPLSELDRDRPALATMPDRWIRRNGTPYWNPDDVVSIQINGQTIYSATRSAGVTINQLPFLPYFRIQFRSLMFHFRWSLDILGWFIRKCLQCPHWRHHQVTSPFAD